MGASLRHDISKFNSRFAPGASGQYHHRGSLPLPLPARHERGEGWGEGHLPSNWRGQLESPSRTLSPLLCRGERESTSGMVVVLRCTLTRPTLLEDCLTFSVNQPNFMARLNTRRVVAARFSLRKAQAGCAS